MSQINSNTKDDFQVVLHTVMFRGTPCILNSLLFVLITFSIDLRQIWACKNRWIGSVLSKKRWMMAVFALCVNFIFFLRIKFIVQFTEAPAKYNKKEILIISSQYFLLTQRKWWTGFLRHKNNQIKTF